MKTCKGCGTEKPLDEYHACKAVKDGRKSRCKECANAASRAWRAENPDAAARAVDRWREENPDAVREMNRRWKAANPAVAKAWRERAAAHRADYLRAWKESNRDRVREYQRRRRAAGYGGPMVGGVDTDLLWTQCEGLCSLCGEQIDETAEWPDLRSKSIDHILPLSRGGMHSQENVQWACLGCNLRKGNRLPERINP